jgi:hypothetical protein
MKVQDFLGTINPSWRDNICAIFVDGFTVKDFYFVYEIPENILEREITDWFFRSDLEGCRLVLKLFVSTLEGNFDAEPLEPLEEVVNAPDDSEVSEDFKSKEEPSVPKTWVDIYIDEVKRNVSALEPSIHSYIGIAERSLSCPNRKHKVELLNNLLTTIETLLKDFEK